MAPGRLTAQAVADLVGGRLLGNGDVVLTRLGPLEGAAPDTLAFLVSPRYLPYFRASTAGAVLIGESFAAEREGPATRIVVREPEQALLTVAEALHPAGIVVAGVDPTAQVDSGVSLGAGVRVGPYAVLEARACVGARAIIGAGAWVGEGVVIGEDACLGPHAVVHPGSRLGARVVLKAGAVVGGEGFGFLRVGDEHRRLPHVGGCVLEDDVEIGSHSCVDRGSFEDTIIGRGTKIDNLVHVGHNVRIGRRCLIMATTGIAGSVRLGDDVIVAGAVGISDHVLVGDGARLSAKSVVIGDVAPGQTVGGYPARNHREFLRAQGALYRLPPLIDHLETIVREWGTGGTTNG